MVNKKEVLRLEIYCEKQNVRAKKIYLKNPMLIYLGSRMSTTISNSNNLVEMYIERMYRNFRMCERSDGLSILEVLG